MFILTSLMFTYISSIWNCNKIYKLQQPQPQLNPKLKKKNRLEPEFVQVSSLQKIYNFVPVMFYLEGIRF